MCIWYPLIKYNEFYSKMIHLSTYVLQWAAYRKERLVIFREDWVGGRARVTIDEEHLLWQCWTEIKSWRYWGLLWEPYKLEKGVFVISWTLLFDFESLSSQFVLLNRVLKFVSLLPVNKSSGPIVLAKRHFHQIQKSFAPSENYSVSSFRTKLSDLVRLTDIL